MVEWSGRTLNDLVSGRKISELFTKAGFEAFESALAALGTATAAPVHTAELDIDLIEASGNLKPVRLVACLEQNSATTEPVLALTVIERAGTSSIGETGEQKLRRLIDGIDSYNGMLDVNGTVLEINRSALTAAGMTHDQAIGKKLWECLGSAIDEPAIGQLQKDVALASRGQSVRRNVYVRTADEQRIVVDLLLAPSCDAEGNVIGVIASAIDITERSKVEAARNRLAEIVERSVDFIGTFDQEGRLLYLNQAGLNMTGRSLEQAHGRPLQAFHPDWTVERILGEGLRATEETGSWTSETALLSASGEELAVSQAIIAHTDSRGRTTHYSSVMRDISGLKATEEHQKILLREILHRSKNLLAVVQAMASQTARSSTSAEQFVVQFKRRVQGLSTSLDLLVDQHWEGVGLLDLVLGQVRSFLGNVEDRKLSIDGPPVILTAAAAQALGLALHELGTNAVKHGSLSVSSGKLSVTWDITEDADLNSRLVMRWTESDGPQVIAPSHKGFGSTVIETMVAQSLDGDVLLEYNPSGVRWTLSARASSCLAKPDSTAGVPLFNPISGLKS